MSNSSGAGELELIAILARHFAEGRGTDVRVGMGDDAAVLSGSGELVVTCDSFVDGVHFRPEWAGWQPVGYKAAVTTISDLAAMAVPAQWITLALGLEAPSTGDAGSDGALAVVDGIGAGVAEAAAEYGCTVVGGDISVSGTTFLSLTAGGRTTEPPILRSGARDGDLLVVAGRLGRSAAALLVLAEGAAAGGDDDDSRVVIAHFVRPRAGFADAEALRDLGARALIDISDGLASEASHIAARSGVGVVLEAASVPVDEAARRIFERCGVDPESAAITSGEEYALLAAVPADRRDALDTACRRRNWTIVGYCTANAATVALERPDGTRRPLGPDALGWRHFDRGR